MNNVISRRRYAVFIYAVLIFAALTVLVPVRASAEEAGKLVTDYNELWTSEDITVTVGETVKWYVNVPEDTEPKGCGATIKIPDLGFGTDTHNKEEGHIVLKKGENFIYEFTPEKTGDILFTCWMGSGCHKNYIHVTEAKENSEKNEEQNDENVQTIVTDYADLWTGAISAKPGKTIKWYVNVPEDVEPKGCGATIKIPDLGFGTDTHNKEEGHIVLKKGENFIYEFTPEKTGDILFTCWMGSGCHFNYFHITEDGTYSVPKPEDVTEVSAVRKGTDVTVRFKTVDAPAGSEIRGYKIIATDEDGKRTKVISDKDSAVLEGINEAKAYTFTVTTLGTSGKSSGSSKVLLKAGAENSVKALKGDADLSGEVNVSDIAVIASHIKGIKALSSEGTGFADADGSGDISVTDIAKIASHIKGIKSLDA